MDDDAPRFPGSTQLFGYSVIAGVFSTFFCETMGLDSPLIMLVSFLVVLAGIIFWPT